MIKMGKNLLQNPIQCQYQNTEATMIQLKAYVIKKTIKDFGTVSWVESSEFLPLYLPTWLTAPGSIYI